MPRAWRLVKEKHLSTAFDGEGARLYGGRWNSPGKKVVYLADSLSLAALEILVHVQSSGLLQAYSSISADIPEHITTSIDPADLPNGWHRNLGPYELQRIGDDWISSEKSAALKVPSAVVQTQYILLLNPDHSAFNEIEIGVPSKFEFDSRLVK